MKNNKTCFFVTTLLCLAPILLGLALYDKLPDLIPTHWGADGQVNGYTPKPWAVFGLPAFFAAINSLVHFTMNADPKRQNIGKNIRMIGLWTSPVLALVIMPMSYLWALGYQNIPVERIVPVLVGVLFIGIGNYLPKCRQNYTSGIKLPWTLNDEENWNKTHHMAGRLWIAGGLLMMVNAFWGGLWFTLAVTAAMVAVPALYSYLLYRKKERDAK